MYCPHFWVKCNVGTHKQMVKTGFSIAVAAFIAFNASISHAQGDDKIDVFTSVSATDSSTCTKFALGSPVETVTPDYPEKARSKRLGGAVRLIVQVDETGKVAKVLETEGDELLRDAAGAAAQKTRFTVSRCDGKPVPVKGVLIFNFVPIALTDVYISHAKAEAYTDITFQSPYYEPILALTENYKLAFGYADGNFHPAAPLTKGDFAHFLRLTLDLLQQRAEVSKKIPREIDLFFPLNPLKLKSAAAISDLDSRKPYFDSVGFLISKYDIALTNSQKQFQGKLPLTQNEVIDYWKTIFGEDSVPVNFSVFKDGDRIMSRGEFALFLHESLYVLTYKVLP